MEMGEPHAQASFLLYKHGTANPRRAPYGVWQLSCSPRHRFQLLTKPQVTLTALICAGRTEALGMR